jgi:hypothetical protein
MNPATVVSSVPGDAAPNKEDRVFLWRCEELRRAGYGPEAASLLAAIPDLDLDLAIELRVRRLHAS